MVAGASVKHTGMNIGTRASGKALEEIAYQFHMLISHSRRADFGIDHRRRASSEIDGGETESFIHGHDKVAGAQNSAAISQRAVEDLAQSNADVFYRVVLVHVQIAYRRQFQIEAAVPRKELQHVVEKTDSRGDLVLPATFNRERNPNLGFRGLAMQLGLPHTLTSRRLLMVSIMPRSASIRVRTSSPDPTVRRTQPSHPGSKFLSRTRIPRVRKA